jgi:hypothetical protein
MKSLIIIWVMALVAFIAATALAFDALAIGVGLTVLPQPTLEMGEAPQRNIVITDTSDFQTTLNGIELQGGIYETPTQAAVPPQT